MTSSPSPGPCLAAVVPATVQLRGIRLREAIR